VTSALKFVQKFGDILLYWTWPEVYAALAQRNQNACGRELVVNVVEVERTMRYIQDHPDRHNQAEWICGTGGCYAGLTCLLSGWKSFLGTELVYKNADEYDCDTSQLREVQEVARGILGIDLLDSMILFHGSNTVDKLMGMSKDLMNGEPLALHWTATIVDDDVIMEER
jgi:hypothetical protein